MNAVDYLEKEVILKIDRPLGSRHPQYGFIYMLNYGYVPDTISGDGEELDVYLIGEFEPVKTSSGKVIAIIHRTNDDDDKLIVSKNGEDYSDDAIRTLTEFQEGFFDYVVPPLEGFWWQDGLTGSIDYDNKDAMHFISIIRLPDFVTKEDFKWAIEEATKKKKQDFSRVEFLTYEEGLCVQCMHIGSYNDEPATVNAMHEYMKENGYELDITDERYHHEIYLSDPRKCDNNKLKTVIRHPIKKINRDSTNHF